MAAGSVYGTSPQNRTYAQHKNLYPVILERPTAVIKLKTCISFTLTGSLVQRFQRKTSSSWYTSKYHAIETAENLFLFLFRFRITCSVCVEQ